MKDFIKKWILNRWQYKVAAFMTAFILWVYVVSEQNLSININIPIEFANYPADLQITNKVRTSADISLEGRRDIVNQMEKKDIKAVVDLKGAKAGRNDYIIDGTRIKSIPRGLHIKNITPAGITIEFETLVKTEPKEPAKPVPKENPDKKIKKAD
jgi:YbbR domain-containing protein